MAARNPQKTKGLTAAQTTPQLEPLHVDLQNKVVKQGTSRLSLRPREFAVLRCLMEHAGKLVTKEALYEAVWQTEGIAVGDDAITTCIYEIRQALGEKTKVPRYIETRPKYGYCFIGPIAASAAPVSSSTFKVPSAPPPSAPDLEKDNAPSAQPGTWNLKPGTFLVGREAELAQLQQHLEKALNSERQIVFVSGEPGVGKTTLVEAFLSGTRQQGPGNRQQGSTGLPQPIPDARSLMPSLWIAWGQCTEHYGSGEAYQPVLEALTRLARGVEGEYVIAALRRHAPTWLLQMPTLLAEEEIEALQRKVSGSSQERMLREMQETLETLTVVRPLVLWIEDVQWSDYSTLDLLAGLANRREPARLLVIATYRLTEIAAKEEHPLQKIKAALQLHRQCEEIPLGFFTVEEVDGYLTARFPASTLPGELTAVLHRQTGGNPLFLTTVVEDLVQQGVIVNKKERWELKVSADEVRAKAPESVRQMIVQQIGRLPKTEQRLLEVASVVGQKFSSVALTTELAEPVEHLEEQCEELARAGQLVRTQETERWPDGTVATLYAFRHPLYRDVVYQQLTESQRIRTHQRVGEWLEQAYGERAREVAAELSMHFEQGERYEKAGRYLRHAAEKALQRGATREAVDLLTHGLMLLRKAPEHPRRSQQERLLRIMLGTLLLSTKGYAAAEIAQARRQARELRQKVGETREFFPALCELWATHFVAADLPEARKCGEQLLKLAKRERDATLQLSAHYLLGTTLSFLGEFVAAREHLQRVHALFDRQEHEFLTVFHEEDPEVLCLSLEAFVLWHLGYPDQALTKAGQAVAVAQSLGHTASVAESVMLEALLRRLCRVDETEDWREARHTLLPEFGFVSFLATGAFPQAWSLAKQEAQAQGRARLQPGLAPLQMTGGSLLRPYLFTVLASAYGEAKQIEEGFSTLDEAFGQVKQSQERWWEAELYRLKGEMLLRLEEQKNGSKG